MCVYSRIDDPPFVLRQIINLDFLVGCKLPDYPDAVSDYTTQPTRIEPCNTMERLNEHCRVLHVSCKSHKILYFRILQ